MVPVAGSGFPAHVTGKPKLLKYVPLSKHSGEWAMATGLACHNGGIAEIISHIHGDRCAAAAGSGHTLQNDLRLSSLDRVELLGRWKIVTRLI